MLLCCLHFNERRYFCGGGQGVGCLWKSGRFQQPEDPGSNPVIRKYRNCIETIKIKSKETWNSPSKKDCGPNLTTITCGQCNKAAV